MESKSEWIETEPATDGTAGGIEGPAGVPSH